MNTILNILVTNLSPDKDPEVRLKLFMLLAEVLSQYEVEMLESDGQRDKMEIFVKNIVEGTHA